MKTHQMQQGTPEWHSFRATHFTASDAPAMLGQSPHKTRNDLLKEKATGVSAEVNSATQSRFDDGHRFEALARPLAEKIIGEELYPVVGSDGKLAASFDGLTMLEDVCFEHKTLNAEIQACKSANDLPEHYLIQMQQQMMVSGASRCLFMASKWDADDKIIGEPFIGWYESDPTLAQQIEDGWAQFEKDLANYQHVEAKPEAVGQAPDMLPALRIEVTGMVTASNLAEFKASALKVFQGIKTQLDTDEDFASADKTAKWCKEVEDRLEAAKQHALSQTASIDELFRTVDAIKDEARQKRLTLEKLVKSRKESIKIERIEAARRTFQDYVETLRRGISGANLIIQQPDFGGAIKGLKTLGSIQNAIDTLMAKAKIEADAQARDARQKMDWFVSNKVHHGMVPDLQSLLAKPLDDFVLTINSRIERRKKEEEIRLEFERERIRREETAKLEAERERIRREEAAKLAAQQQVEAERERIRREEEAKLAAEHERARQAETAKLEAQQVPAVQQPAEQEVKTVAQPAVQDGGNDKLRWALEQALQQSALAAIQNLLHNSYNDGAGAKWATLSKKKQEGILEKVQDAVMFAVRKTLVAEFKS